MIRIIDKKLIPRDRRYKMGEDDFKDITSDLEVEDSVCEHLTPFIHNGLIYSPCQFSKQSKVAICEKTPVDVKVYYEYTDDITCPYCGHKNTDSWEMPDDSDEEICEYCDSKFGYDRIVTVDYVSVKIKKGILKEI